MKNSQAQIGTAAGLLGGLDASVVGRLLAYDYDVEQAMRAYSPLLPREQILYDSAVSTEFLDRLQVTRRLIANGQTFRLSRPFAHAAIEHMQEDDTQGATRSRNPLARSEWDLPNRVPVQTPIYYTFADFSLTLPDLETSRNTGVGLDTSLIRQKARDISEDIEDAVINGPGVQVAGNPSYGLLNAPNINTFTLSGGLNWDSPAKTAEQILTDFQTIFTALDDQRSFGPIDVWLPVSWFNALSFKRRTNTSDRTVIQDIGDLRRGNQPLFIGQADRLPADQMVAYIRSSSVVDLIVGDFGGQKADDDPNAPDTNPVPITVLPWQEKAGLVLNWKLISALIPRPKSNFSGKSGIIKNVVGS